MIKTFIKEAPVVKETNILLETLVGKDSPEMLHLCSSLINDDPINILHLAARMGSLKICQAMIDRGADVNSLSKGILVELKKATALYRACGNGHAVVAKYLIGKGANIESGCKGFSPLYIACKFNSIKCARLLLNKGADINTRSGDGSTPLYVASQQGNLEIVKLLIEHNADVELGFLGGYTPLYIASQNGKDEIVRLLCLAGSNVNKMAPNRTTALYVTSQNAHLKCVRNLLEFGANPEIDQLNYGFSPLYIATQKGWLSIVQALVEYGVDVNLGNDIALTIACKNGHEAIAEYLIINGSNIEHRSSNGYTPLFWAVINKKTHIVNMLCAKGALINISCYNGDYLYNMASKECKNVLDKYLVRSGIKR